MVCPMKQKDNRPQDRPTEYPYEPLYRPWSWIFSSLCNVFLIAILFLTIYAMYRRSKSKGKRQTTYRTVVTDKSDVLESRGKIKAVVTGGSGSLGGEIVRGLIEDGGYLVHSLDLFIPDTEKRNSDVHTYIQADIGDRDSLRLALKDIEVVFHTAGIIPTYVGHTRQDFHDVIATGTENIVATCKELGVKRLLYTSSIAVLLENDPNQIVDGLDESTPYAKHPRDAYGAAKIIAEKCVLEANGNNLSTCALRPNRVICARSIKLAGSTAAGDSSLKQQIIPVDTAGNIHILAEKKLLSDGVSARIAGKPLIITLEDEISAREMADALAAERGEESGSIPLWLYKTLAFVNEAVFFFTGKAPINSALRIDMVPYAEKSHTYSASFSKRELGWEDKRSCKEVLKIFERKSKESKKNN